MYSRIHFFKFPNKVIKDSFRFFCENYTNKLFDEGLKFSIFIDVKKTHLHYLIVWKNKKDSEILLTKAKEYSDVKTQAKKIGATISIVGGEIASRTTSKSNFNLFEKISL